MKLGYKIYGVLAVLLVLMIVGAAYAVNTEQTATQTMISLGIIGTVCGAGAGFFIVRLMVGPIRDAAEIMKRISQGDFRSSIDITSTDEFGQFNVNMSEMQQKLKDQIESDEIALASTGRIKAALNTSTSARWRFGRKPWGRNTPM